MLIGIPPMLGPELLATLRAMGHGDEIALVDGNYPALTHARLLIRADGLPLIPLLDAILQVLPVDDFVPQALFRASVKGNAPLADQVHEEMEMVCTRRAPGRSLVALGGEPFYARVKNAHAIVATGEPRLYANIIIRKGVIYPGKEI
ncbi:RbsD/FucU family protein [Phyllobacterium endophyticum]|uniref:Transporter n=1 Tax=Phyllobacterium endophyticum TaxID=1149773 RepID=A0A2P7ARM9_9HYPH|nr:RbsD/FucU domain-containing protein [Phyllobacterium endophyticum]MBB3236556.1 L-fucose mutarotase [Phyllobacterium endophyticum]PSH56882.1 transporter [Phyllobacterium endophyticum]TXR49680.1 transporter [Phyllobacterium endophyticum]TYR39559.1 transporter [Phyllobacterium endophyticum]